MRVWGGKGRAVPLSLRRTCRDVLALSGWERERLVIGLLSSLPGEGVTTVALGMATVLAETHDVLLVDASYSRRSAARAARLRSPVLTADELEAIDAETGAAILDERIAASPAGGFHVLSLEPSQHMATALGRAWPRLLDALGTRYGIVLVDLGSLRTQLSPAWSSLLDRTFVVVDSVRTTTEDLTEAKQTLSILRYPLSGAIMNRSAAERRGWLGGAR